MLAVTYAAIVLKIKDLINGFKVEVVSGNVLQLLFAILLFILGILVAIEGLKKLFDKREETVELKKTA